MPDEQKLLSDEEVAEIEARANAASTGPWLVTDGQHIDQYDHHPDGNRLLSEGSYYANYHMFGSSDVEFIAHAREDIPALCQTVRALRAERDSLTDEPKIADDALENQTQLIGALRQQLAQTEARLKVITDDRNLLYTENKELQSQLAQVEQECNRLQQQLSGEQALDKLTDRHLKKEIHDAIEELRQP